MKYITPVLIIALTAGCASSTSVRPNATPAPSPSPSPSASPNSGAKKSVTAGGKEIRCFLAKDERIIMVAPNSPGCEVYYTKPGGPDPLVVATSKKGLAHCNSVLEKMRTNLTNAGFTCK